MKFFRITFEILTDFMGSLLYAVKSNLMNFVRLVEIALPFAMYFIGQYVSCGKLNVGYELLIPVGVLIITGYMKAFANKIGKGITVPVPEKRFTSIDEDGEVSIENSRLQELILYMADLEDWLKSKGLENK